MADTGPIKKDAAPWLALKDATVVGARLLDVADWIVRSGFTEGEERSLDVGTPRLVLPSIQRSAVWRTDQVLDFWDSVLRGLPVGAFYVMRSGNPQEGRRLGAGDDPNKALLDVREDDYLLLDGQQRLRALTAGLATSNDDKRSIWIDLSKISLTTQQEVGAPFLFLTSQAQPFGYDNKTGRKLSVSDRTNARKQFSENNDKTQNTLHLEGRMDARVAYNHELFSGSIVLKTENGDIRRLPTPPKPSKACAETTVRLADLFNAWISDPGNVLDVLEQRQTEAFRIGPSLKDTAAKWLQTVFTRLEKARVALIVADVADANPSVAKRNVSALFTRIGTGGTVLSRDERLYSIYKHYVSDAFRLVEAVRSHAGRILPAVRIAGTALRIAHARARIEEAKQHGNYGTPDEEAFITAVTGETPLKRHLETLMRPEKPADDGLLSQAFLFLRQSVQGSAGDAMPNREALECPFWIPDVLLASLPGELWDVLAFWAVQNSASRDVGQSRPEIVRFILFWLLCVENNEKAGTLLFEAIADNRTGQACFPGPDFYRRLVRAGGEKPYVLELIQPAAMRGILEDSPKNGVWPAWKDRFEKGPVGQEPNKRNVERLAAHWWHGGGRRMLPWLQRVYIAENFKDYVPLGAHEDDLPYDVDHICAHDNWGEWWGATKADDRFPEMSKPERDKMKDARHVLGNSVGNLQLLGASANRTARAVDFEKKPWTTSDDYNKEIWKRVASADDKLKIWHRDRRIAFQSAVEDRAAWLYEHFFCKLEYGPWLAAADQAALSKTHDAAVAS